MSKTYDSATVELAVTLSTLAYVDETATQQQTINEINAGLKEAGYEAWQVVWGPALNVDRSNLGLRRQERRNRRTRSQHPRFFMTTSQE